MKPITKAKKDLEKLHLMKKKIDSGVLFIDKSLIPIMNDEIKRLEKIVKN